LFAGGLQPDALVLGPESGYDLARDLCAALPDRPLLVAITGRLGLADRSRAAGFDYHFLKPTDLTALRRVLADHADRPGRTAPAA